MSEQIDAPTDPLYNVAANDADEMEDLRTLVALIALRQGPATAQWIEDVRAASIAMWTFYGRRAKARLAGETDPVKPEIDLSGLSFQILTL